MLIIDNVGQALQLLRTRRGWPQKQLAAAARITKGMVSSYEKGKQSPTLATLNKILKALGADLCDLHWAVEFVNGRQRPVHDLSAHFQLGPAGSLRATAWRPVDAGATSTEPGEPDGEPDREPRLPDSIETALRNATESVHQIARYLLLVQGAKQG
jgi:transcriptional regulator with XRE-family HTH domain